MIVTRDDSKPHASAFGVGALCTRGVSISFELLDVFVDLHLQLAQLLQRAVGDHAKVAWALSKDFIAVRFKNALHPSHLLDGLVELFGCFDHDFILKPCRCLTY